MVASTSEGITTKSARVDRCGLFGQHSREASTDLDLWPKACGPCRL